MARWGYFKKIRGRENMKKYVQLGISIIAGCLILTGCSLSELTMSSAEKERQIREELSLIQGNDLFEIGDKLWKAYAEDPERNSICFLIYYRNVDSLTKSEYKSKKFSEESIKIYVHYIPNSKELSVQYVHFDKSDYGKSNRDKVLEKLDLKYRGRGNYVTLDNQPYTKFNNLILINENKKIEFEKIENRKLSYSFETGKVDLNGELEKTDELFDSFKATNPFLRNQSNDARESDKGFRMSKYSKSTVLDTYIQLESKENRMWASIIIKTENECGI